MADEEEAQAAYTLTIARGVAFFIGAFTLFNIVRGLASPGYDSNLWWIDLRPLPRLLSITALAVCGILLVAHGIVPALLGSRPAWRRGATTGAVLFLATATAANAVTAVTLRIARVTLGRGWIPLSFLISLALSVVLVSLGRRRPEGPRPRLDPAVVALTVACCTVAAAIAQMVTFGLTDYRRPADLIVVFGARAYANGTPSDALSDRVTAAAELYRQGLAPRVLMSGGPGDGASHETVVMRDLAVSLGVPAGAIIRDPQGVDTASTVRTTRALLPSLGARRVLAVSHFYHLPRVKMSFHRVGVHEVFTVPSPMRRVMARLPWFMAREVAALWVYWLTQRPGASSVTVP